MELEDKTIDGGFEESELGQNFRPLLTSATTFGQPGPAMEALSSRCPELQSLVLGRFYGICRVVGPELDGVALCRRLESLSIMNCADLNDYGMMAILQGCPKLAKFEIYG